MHIRVLLSKYRSYTKCPACDGARLKLEAQLWRIGTKEQADSVLPPEQRHMPHGVDWTRDQLEALPGLGLHDMMLLPIDRLRTLLRPAADARGPARRGAEAAARRDLHAPEIPQRRRHRLPHARSPEPHAVRRRGAAHQPHHRAGHLAGQHAVRAGRAVDRPASARHAPHRRGHAAPARRRQHAGGGGARPRRDAGGRPPDRHGPRPGRAGRPDRVRRRARRRPSWPTRSPAPTSARASRWAWASAARWSSPRRA